MNSRLASVHLARSGSFGVLMHTSRSRETLSVGLFTLLMIEFSER